MVTIGKSGLIVNKTKPIRIGGDIIYNDVMQDENDNVVHMVLGFAPMPDHFIRARSLCGLIRWWIVVNAREHLQDQCNNCLRALNRLERER